MIFVPEVGKQIIKQPFNSLASRVQMLYHFIQAQSASLDITQGHLDSFRIALGDL